MSVSNELMVGYLLKCGVPANIAELASFKTGALYLDTLNLLRSQGHGKKSKALSAITCINMVIAHFIENGFENKQSDKELERLESTLDELVAAGLALAAVKTFAFSEKSLSKSGNYSESELGFAEELSIIDAITIVADSCSMKVADEIKITIIDTYKAKLPETVAVAKAYANKKGFLTRLFG